VTYAVLLLLCLTFLHYSFVSMAAQPSLLALQIEKAVAIGGGLSNFDVLDIVISEEFKELQVMEPGGAIVPLQPKPSEQPIESSSSGLPPNEALDFLASGLWRAVESQLPFSFAWEALLARAVLEKAQDLSKGAGYWDLLLSPAMSVTQWLDKRLNRLPPKVSLAGASKKRYSVAMDRGYVYIPSDSQTTRRVSIHIPLHDPCLGHLFARLLLRLVGGEDVAVVSTVHHVFGGVGFVRVEQSGYVFTLARGREIAGFRKDGLSWLLFKVGTLCTALFMVFAATGFTSFVFHETQRRMVRFTLALGHAIWSRRPVIRLIAAHSIESLVFVPVIIGVLFFMIEFFSDKLMAFLVFMALWACEVFAVVACRTVQSIRVFPVAVLLSFTWLMVYVLAFPFGLHHLALACVMAALQCSAFFQWTSFELPALQSGRLTQHRIREILAISPAQGLTSELAQQLQRGRADLVAGLGLGGGLMPAQATIDGLNASATFGGVTSDFVIPPSPMLSDSIQRSASSERRIQELELSLPLTGDPPIDDDEDDEEVVSVEQDGDAPSSIHRRVSATVSRVQRRSARSLSESIASNAQLPSADSPSSSSSSSSSRVGPAIGALESLLSTASVGYTGPCDDV
jgi:hypothetical protein